MPALQTTVSLLEEPGFLQEVHNLELPFTIYSPKVIPYSHSPQNMSQKKLPHIYRSEKQRMVSLMGFCADSKEGNVF